MEKKVFKFKVTAEDKKKRTDKFLVEKFPGELSRSFIQRVICEGGVRLNGSPVKNNNKLDTGDLLEIDIPETRSLDLVAEDIKLDIVYEDDQLLIVNKPAGMVVHPAPGNYSGTLVNALLGRERKLSSVGGRMKPGIVHRLDKGTSGLLIVAKTDEAHRRLSKQFAKKISIKRVYIAVVKGAVELDNGIVELPIGRSHYDRKKMAVKFENSKDAVTRYKVLERFKRATLLELELGTGRTHQIRVHMSHIGHPIVGDDKYGSEKIFRRPALHAKTIGFIHPSTKEYMEFSSELPEDIRELIKEERMRYHKL